MKMNRSTLVGCLVSQALLMAAGCRATGGSEAQGSPPNPLHMVSFDQCDIDIRPKGVVPNTDMNLLAEYANDAKKPQVLDLRLTMMHDPAQHYDVKDAAGDELTELETRVSSEIVLTWDLRMTPATVKIVSGDHSYSVTANGSYVATDRDLSPCFEREVGNEFIRIHCQYRGWSTYLVVQ